MARLMGKDELTGHITVMLEERREDGQLMLRPEAIQSVDETGMVDMWNTVQKVTEYNKAWRCWEGVPSIMEQVEAVWDA